jgi:hypothetical protein
MHLAYPIHAPVQVEFVVGKISFVLYFMVEKDQIAYYKNFDKGRTALHMQNWGKTSKLNT